MTTSNKIITLLFSCVLFSSCSNGVKPKRPVENSNRNIQKFRNYGRYGGVFGFYTDTIKGVQFAIIGSSAAQVYEGDKSFDCTLLLIEDSNSINPNLSFNMFNVSDTSPVFCGKADIQVATDTTIILSLNPDNENIGPCNATIDFKERAALTREKNADLNEVDSTGRGSVESEKSFIYKQPSNEYATKAYLIKGDNVAVLEMQKDWSKIVYLDANRQPHQRWIKTQSLKVQRQ